MAGEDVILAYFSFMKIHKNFAAIELDFWYKLYVSVCHLGGVKKPGGVPI